MGVITYVIYPPEKIKSILTEKLSISTGRKIHLGSAKISFLPIGISIENLKISQPNFNGFSKNQAVKLKQGTIVLALTSLLQGQVEVKKIQAQGFDLNFEVLKNGKTSLTGLGEDNSQKASKQTFDENSNKLNDLPVDVDLSDISLSDFNISYKNHQTKQDVKLEDLSFNSSLFISSNLQELKTTGSLDVSKISAKDRRSGLKTGKVSMSVSYNMRGNLREGTVDLVSSKIKLQNFVLALNGKMKDAMSDDPHIKFGIQSDKINLSEVLDEIPVGLHSEVNKLNAEGSFLLDLVLASRLSRLAMPKINGKIVLDQIGIYHQDISAKLKNLSGKIKLTESKVSVPHLSMKFANQPIKIKADVVGLPNKPHIKHFESTIKINLKELQALASKIIVWPEGLNLAGTIDSKIKASGKVNLENPSKIKLKGNINFKKLRIQTPAIKQAVKLNGNVVLSSTKIVPELKVKMGKEDLNLKMKILNPLSIIFAKNGKGKKTSVDFKLKSKRLNLDKILSSSDGNATEPNSPLPKKNPIVPDVNLDGHIELASTVYQNLKLKDFKMDIRMRDRILQTDVKGLLYGGTLNQTSQANLKNPKKGKIKTKVTLKGVDVNPLINDYNDQLMLTSPLSKSISKMDNTIYGKINLNFNLNSVGVPATYFDNAKANLTSNILNGKIKNSKMLNSINSAYGSLSKIGFKVSSLKEGTLHFSNLKNKMKLSHGKLILESLKIKKTIFGDLDMKGALSKNGKLNLKALNLLSLKDSKKISKNPRTALAFPFQGERAQVFMKIGGQVSKPSVSIDLKKMAQKSKGGKVLDSQLKKGKSKVNKVLQNGSGKLKKSLKKDLTKNLKGIL